MTYKVVFTNNGRGMLNFAVAENKASVAARYADYKVVSITEADMDEADRMKQRGCPVITCETVAEVEEMAAPEETAELHVTEHSKNTKMDGFFSLNTSCLCNENCKQRQQDPKTVCSHCYAAALLKRYKGVDPHCIKNGEILRSRILTESELIDTTGRLFFRFEAFGDLINDIHFINLLNTCKKNKATVFALWTKNLGIVYDVLHKMGYEKPRNLVIVASSTYLNKPVELPAELLQYIDHIFTVYTRAYAEEHDIPINCGARHCMSCLQCYCLPENGAPFEINELLK